MTVLLYSQDEPLATAVQALCQGLKSCEFFRMPPFAVNSAGQPNVRHWDNAVVLVHAEANTLAEIVGLITNIREKSKVPVIVILDDFDGETMVACMRAGARDCINRPLDLRRLKYLIDFCTIGRLLPKSAVCFQSALDILLHAPSPAMATVMKHADLVAPSLANILLTGETGVGKTCLARYIHEHSLNANGPFIDINCGAIPKELIESELFGHTKGAFTGADQMRQGRFSLAEKGTIFLDEVDSLPMSVQAKLLRALDSKRFEAIGSNKSIRLEARIISAACGSLSKAVDQGCFRPDLFFRLQGVQLHLPTLCQRSSEIRLWAQLFANQASQSQIQIGASAWFFFESYHWPGNIRELKNVVTQAVTMCQGSSIEVGDLPAALVESVTSEERGNAPMSLHPVTNGANVRASGRDVGDADQLKRILADCSNNRSAAAKKLGISRTALYKRLARFSMQ